MSMKNELLICRNNNLISLSAKGGQQQKACHPQMSITFIIYVCWDDVDNSSLLAVSAHAVALRGSADLRALWLSCHHHICYFYGRLWFRHDQLCRFFHSRAAVISPFPPPSRVQPTTSSSCKVRAPIPQPYASLSFPPSTKAGVDALTLQTSAMCYRQSLWAVRPTQT